MTDKEKFEKEALAEFIEMTGIPKERVNKYSRVQIVGFPTCGETYELKTPGLAVTLYTCSSPVLYFPKKHYDILNEVKSEIIDKGAFEQEIHGKTEFFLEGINYCLSVIDKHMGIKEVENGNDD